jgi:hypothetical protein
MSLPPIVAKITADTAGLDKGLAGAQAKLGSFSKAATVAGAAVGAAAIGLVALTKASMANIDALAKQARSLGLTVSAFQKMSLVANEAGIETGKLTSMLGLMQRNIDGLVEGTAAQTKAFGALGLSIADLRGLTADEQFEKIASSLDKITDPARKTALAMDVFGRSGRDAINMLSGYSDAVKNAEFFQKAFGIALTDTEAQGVERANDAVGRLGMVFEGLGNRLAVLVSGPLENVTNAFIDLLGAMVGVTQKTQELQNIADIMDRFGDTSNVKAMTGDVIGFVDLLQRSDAMSLLEDMAYAYDNLAETAGRATSAMAGDIQALSEEYPLLGDALMNMSTEVDRLSIALQNALDAGDIEAANQYREQLGIAVENLQKAVASADALSGLDLSGSVSWANSLAGAFGGVLSSIQAVLGAAAEIPGAAVDFGALGNDERGTQRGIARDVGSMRSADSVKSRGAGAKGGGGGGGGGLADQLAQRLEVLMDGLQTEAEMVAAWYAEQQMTLEEALAAKMLTEAEYMEARERLEQEHQERLAAIRDMGNQWSLSAALKGGAEILGAMGASNKKALKVQKVFAAAAALVDTYQGAAAELKKGTFGFAAAAAVIAKGFGFIAAIKGVSDSGGGTASASSGGRGGATAPAQQNTQTLNFTIQNDRFGFGENIVRQIVTQLNEASRNGSSVRGTMAQ